MMKRILLGLVLLFALTSFAPAFAADVMDTQSEVLELDQLEDAAGDYLDGMKITEDLSFQEGLIQLLETGSGLMGGMIKRAVRSGVLLLVIVLFCSMTAAFQEETRQGGVLDVVPLAGALAIMAVSVMDIHSLIRQGGEAIAQMETFSKALLPTLAASAAASGSLTGATMQQVATLFFSDVLITLIGRVLMPLVYAYTAVCAAYAALGNQGLRRIASLLKWVVVTSISALLLGFVGYLSVSGVIAGKVDAAAIKATKTAVAGLLPVVGSILSDAAESILAGAGILKNSIGIFGMLTVLAICLAPVLQLGIHYLIYKVAAALSATVSDNRMGDLIESVSGAFGLVLGMTGACAMLFLVSIFAAVSAVTI